MTPTTPKHRRSRDDQRADRLTGMRLGLTSVEKPSPTALQSVAESQSTHPPRNSTSMTLNPALRSGLLRARAEPCNGGWSWTCAMRTARGDHDSSTKGWLPIRQLTGKLTTVSAGSRLFGKAGWTVWPREGG